MLIVQNSTDPIPLYVPSASGNFGGDPSLTNLTVAMQAAGGAETQLSGKVIPGKRGAYWYYPQGGDFTTPGRFLLFLNGLPGADMPLPFDVDVVSQTQAAGQTINVSGGLSPTDSANLATMVSLLQRLVTAERA